MKSFEKVIFSDIYSILGGYTMRDKITIENVKKVFEKKGYAFFDNNKKYNLNIIGVRKDTVESDKFDDCLGVIYRDETGELLSKCYTATTDPGKHWLLNPMNVHGTAILVPNQYRGTWKLGTHKGYEALSQYKPVKVWRDADLDDKLDIDVEIEEGMFGINIHRSNPYTQSYYVGKWSAGCQVFAKKKEYDEFLEIVNKSANLYGDIFTYTLITEQDVDEV